MINKRSILLCMGLLFTVAMVEPMTSVYNTNLINESALAVNKSPVLDLNTLGIDYATFTGVFSSATIAAQNFTDGSVSTGSITVTTLTGLAALPASDNITVPTSTSIAGGFASVTITLNATAAQIAGGFAIDSMTVASTNDSVLGSSITVNGNILIGGRDFFTGVTATNTALSLVQAINASGANSYVFASTFQAGATIITSATVVGNFGNTFTLVSTTLTVISTASPTFTKGFDPAFKGAQLKINGITFTNGISYFATDTTSGTAKNLAIDIETRFAEVTATSVSNVIFATAAFVGAWADTFTVTASTIAISPGSSVFSGGFDGSLNNAVITFNGKAYQAGDDWRIADTSSGTATNIANMFDNIFGTTGTAVGSVVFTTATVAGASGNSFTLTVSTPALVISSVAFTGGRDNASFAINGTSLTAGTDWTIADVASSTARNMSNAIMAKTALNTIIISTWNVNGVVSATSTVTGLGTNYTLTASTIALTLSSGAFSGGTTAAISSASAVITIANHRFTTGLSVLYSTSGQTGLTGLTNQTTFFVTPVTTNTFTLSFTSNGAAAGNAAIIITTSNVLSGAHTFSLTPAPITGSYGLTWQVSNDSSTWVNLSVSTVGFNSPFAVITSTWDFGNINWRYLRAVQTAPTTGGVNVVVTGNGKHSNP